MGKEQKIFKNDVKKRETRHEKFVIDELKMRKKKREEQAGAMNKKSTCPFMTAQKTKN